MSLRHLAVRSLVAALSIGPIAAQVPPAAPKRFEPVLWCPNPTLGAPIAQRLGCRSIQLGRGGDPGPVVAAKLGYYLDQPIGKGLLELRDESWRPIAAEYERLRDADALRRPTCFAAPGVVSDAAAAIASEVARVRSDGLRFVALADEASATRHDAPLDTCRCEYCIRAFQQFVSDRLGALDRVNAALGTHNVRLEDVRPPSTDQVRRRELGGGELPGDLRAFHWARAFADHQFCNAVQALAAAAESAAPGVPVGLTGLQVPSAFGGNDYAKLLPRLTLLEPYAVGGAVELARSLGPVGAHRYSTLLPPPADAYVGDLAAQVRMQFAALACAGMAGVVVWNADTVVDARGAWTPFGAAVQAALQQYRPVLDACAGAVVERSPVWIVESQAAVRAWWMIDSADDGMTWPRRLSSYEATHSTSQGARRSWILLLQDLGVQPQFVGDADLPERLLRERPRCLVLPALLAMSETLAQGITAYVRAGGVVIADHSTGLYTETLLRRGSGVLDPLFGVAKRTVAMADLQVRQGKALGAGRPLPLAELHVRGELGDRRDEGDAQIERAEGEGRAFYLNAPVTAYASWRLDERSVEPARELRRRVRAALQRGGAVPPFEVRGEGLPTCLERIPMRLRDGRQVFAVRLNAQDAPALLRQLAQKGPRAITVELPQAMTLRHLAGEAIGSGVKFDLQLDPHGALWLEVVP